MKWILASLLVLPLGRLALAQEADERADWFREARFGLFLHWGVYAVAEGEWAGNTGHAEWLLQTAEIPVATYEGLAERFRPEAFDARAWMKLAARAGMRYVVITTKHHDGFALFDSAVSDWDIMATPWKRDVLREIADAARAEGLRVGWYHSIMDWHHPDYLPRRSFDARPTEGALLSRYVEYLHAQVTELLTRYGPIDVMWFDGEWESTWTHEHGLALFRLCRSLQPDTLVNNRVDKGRAGMAGLTTDAQYVGDFGTPEQEVPAAGLPGVTWETCMTMNDHWGWNRADRSWKSTETLVRTLVDVASKGGNFLLNVGPRPDGTFPPEAIERLEGIGRWMDVNGEAIHGSEASPLAALSFGRATQKSGPGGRTSLYLFVFDWPADGMLRVSDLGCAPARVRLLGRPDASPAARLGDVGLELALPAEPPPGPCPVLALEFEGAPVVHRSPVIEAAGPIFVGELEVRIALDAPGHEVRYTVDGSEPGPSSPRYERALALDASCELRARSFVGGRAVASEARARFERVEPRAARMEPPAARGARLSLYAGSWERLPDFESLVPFGERTVQELELGADAGEHVARRYRGFLEVPASGVWTFALESDDGSRFSIGGATVVDNDGLHGPLERTGEVALAAGWHAFELAWFNRTGGAALALRGGPRGGPLAPLRRLGH